MLAIGAGCAVDSAAAGPAQLPTEAPGNAAGAVTRAAQATAAAKSASPASNATGEGALAQATGGGNPPALRGGAMSTTTATPAAAAGPSAPTALATAVPAAATETIVPVVPGREWHDVRKPLAGPARSIGGYSAGCVAGAEPLPPQGDGYLVMRPSRHRHFGHPQLVDFIRTLGARLKQQMLGAPVIGDLGQPRGGPAPDGHASHQSGLDADLWYPLVATANGIPTNARARRALKALPVANFPRAALTEHWNPRVPRVLQLAATDARVDRIFVNPMIKRALCQSEQDRSWLRKLRPWWGHDAHFHVRLSCPKDSPACHPQPALAQGDGCDQVDWWFSKEATAERDEERARYRAKVGPGDILPNECAAVLAAAD
jgi:penicillin-insensitive murein endopeptidase